MGCGRAHPLAKILPFLQASSLRGGLFIIFLLYTSSRQQRYTLLLLLE